jgi:hypothetical protein
MMNFLKKYAYLYDKIGYQPGIDASKVTTTGVAVARRYDSRIGRL